MLFIVDRLFFIIPRNLKLIRGFVLYRPISVPVVPVKRLVCGWLEQVAPSKAPALQQTGLAPWAARQNHSFLQVQGAEISLVSSLDEMVTFLSRKK